MAKFYKHVRSSIFTSLLFSVFPHSKVSLLSFLQVLIWLCSFTIVLTIFTFNDRLSYQSLILTKFWAPERQHLRLVSPETNSERKLHTESLMEYPLRRDICKKPKRAYGAERVADLQCCCTCDLSPSYEELWSWNGNSLELSQIEARGQALLCSHKPVIYFVPTPTTTTPSFPREINLEWERYLWPRTIPSQLWSFSSRYPQQWGMGEHYSILYNQRLSYTFGNMQCLK